MTATNLADIRFLQINCKILVTEEDDYKITERYELDSEKGWNNIRDDISKNLPDSTSGSSW